MSSAALIKENAEHISGAPDITHRPSHLEFLTKAFMGLPDLLWSDKIFTLHIV